VAPLPEQCDRQPQNACTAGQHRTEHETCQSHTAAIRVRTARLGGLSIADRAILQLRETHTTIREGPHNAATGDGDIYDARARQFAVTAGNYIAPAAGSLSVQRGEPTERMVREAAFSMVCTTIPEIKSRILTTRHPQ
jgi:hypothetical protein